MLSLAWDYVKAIAIIAAFPIAMVLLMPCLIAWDFIKDERPSS